MPVTATNAPRSSSAAASSSAPARAIIPRKFPKPSASSPCAASSATSSAAKKSRWSIRSPIADGKTKSFVAALSALTTPDKILVVSNSFDESTYLAARNVAWVQLVTGSDLNVEQLLLAKSVILVGDAIQSLAQRTA